MSYEEARSDYEYDIEVEAKAEVLDEIIADLETGRALHHNNASLGLIDSLLDKYRNWRNEL